MRPEELEQDVQEKFIDLLNDSVAKNDFNHLSREEFWCKVSSTYPKVAQIPALICANAQSCIILDHIIHEVKISGEVGPCCGFTSCHCKN
jgi:hypothetical protein